MFKISLVGLVALSSWVGCASSTKLPDSSALNSPPAESADGKLGCESPLGFIPDGHALKGYLRPVESGGENCQQGELTCAEGVWSGAYIYPSCVRQTR